MKIDLGPLRKLEEEGLIRSQVHPEFPLIIWNYTEQAQFTKAWNEWTLQARGLITDQEGNIIARPFKKFFNYEEHQGTLPDETPHIIEKVDGSLGIMFLYGGMWRFATRGSFTSEQAEHAHSVLYQSQYDAVRLQWPKTHTHLFEVVYPQNRIVVDYKGADELVYLGSVITETGEEHTDWTSLVSVPFRMAAQLQLDNLEPRGWSLEALKALEKPNTEGFVLRWSNGFRLKIKFEEYKRLHKILTNTTERSIWENLKEGKGIEELIQVVPDEFHKWVQEVVIKLVGQFSDIQEESVATYKRIVKKTEGDRKEFALRAQKEKNPAILFRLYEHKDTSDLIWKLLRPAATKPFTEKEEV